METKLWKAKANTLLPELQEALSLADQPMAFWIEVRDAFEAAYGEPRNQDLIERIYKCAFWCLEHGEQTNYAGTDLPTCIAVAFFEHIPALPASRDDMPRWFSRADVITMREMFSYHIGDAEYERMLKQFGPGKRVSGHKPYSDKRAKRSRRG